MMLSVVAGGVAGVPGAGGVAGGVFGSAGGVAGGVAGAGVGFGFVGSGIFFLFKFVIGSCRDPCRCDYYNTMLFSRK